MEREPGQDRQRTTGRQNYSQDLFTGPTVIGLFVMIGRRLRRLRKTDPPEGATGK